MSGVPQAIHSNLSRPHPTDSRLLQNLIKGEKTYVEHLASSTGAALAASSALTAWGTSEAPDIAAASQALSELLDSVAEAQRTHVQAIEGYRSALKDVLDREQSIRSVVRDRDILVGRLVKASKKKIGKKDLANGIGAEEKTERVQAAQRELHACEQVLASEEAALVGVKRRTFKEALTMRMKTMGDAGAAMVDAAKEAILLLDEFDTHGPLIQSTGGGPGLEDQSMYADNLLEPHDYHEQGPDQGFIPDDENQAETHQQVEANGPRLVSDGFGGYQQTWDNNQIPDPRLSQQFESASVTPSQSASQVNHRSSVPLGKRYSSQFDNIGEQEGAASDTDSEEDYRRAFLEPSMRLPAPHELGVGADTQDNFLPETPAKRSASKRSGHSGGKKRDSTAAVPPALPPKKDLPPPVAMPAIPSAPRLDIEQARSMAAVPAAPQSQFRGNDDDSSDDGAKKRRSMGGGGWGSSKPALTHHQARSPSRKQGDDSSEEGNANRPRRSNSFFGKVGKLFKTDLKAGATPERHGWDTRTGPLLEREETERKRMSMLRRNDPDSSDEEPDTRQLVRHVNQGRPLWGRETNSDVGMKGKLVRTPSAARIIPGPLSAKQDEQRRVEAARASVIGSGFAGQQSVVPASSANSIASKATKKKKKKTTSTGSEIGTAPTRVSATTAIVVAGDASSGIRRSDSLMKPVLSRSSTMQSTSGKKKKTRASIIGGNAFTPSDAKFATGSWIHREQMTAADWAANAGVVPKSANAPTAAPTPVSPAVSSPPTNTSQAAHAAASTDAVKLTQHPSPAKGAPPLKPALKAPSIGRSGSQRSVKSAAGQEPAKTSAGAPVKSPLRQAQTASDLEAVSAPAPALVVEPTRPKMAPVPTAPAPVTSKPLPAEDYLMAVEHVDRDPPKLPEVSVSSGPRPSTAKSVMSLEEDKNFDGTGKLDVGLDDTKLSPTKERAAAAAPKRREFTPKLDMPPSEPFKVELGHENDPARRGSNATDIEGLMTPSAEKAYQAFMSENATPTAESKSNLEKANQPPGVTRLTDRSVKLVPSRVYGTGAPSISDTSSEEDIASAGGRDGGDDEAAKIAVERAAKVHAQQSLADPEQKLDTTLSGLSSAAVPAPAASATTTSSLKVPGAVDASIATGPPSDASGSNVGVSRRKSVRMAPDTKLPPETPTAEEFSTPRGGEYGGKDPLAAAVGAGSQSQSLLSNRIAPPPASPAKAPVKKDFEPVDLAASSSIRERSGWSTRIGQTSAYDDSSDEEGGGGDGDGDSYLNARKAFGSASRHYGVAVGSIKPKSSKKAAAGPAAEVGSVSGKGTGSVRSKASNKSKKRASALAANGGYNPSVPLPSNLEVVAKSAEPQMYLPTAPATLSSSNSTTRVVGQASATTTTTTTLTHLSAPATAPPPLSSYMNSPGPVIPIVTAPPPSGGSGKEKGGFLKRFSRR
ncbi:hypothetical protein IE53DRAFT_369519 [Violaceomyces palustris]|uniref:Uncharacterized protein n=1 Tax=Violaceomyces palustris TaxID=1673888 RepID=A0ACD0NVC5_9BASI|nr:hypothetical protein IE53DRAFT_369519 [Violaceomyces palustris]